MRKNLNTCNFPNSLPAPQTLFLALFSLHYQYLGAPGALLNQMNGGSRIESLIFAIFVTNDLGNAKALHFIYRRFQLDE